ncbi:hypothetical protein T440DRAFT_512651 [Plenodomus tracheiphilus IPT5]|uniref:Uncharacterized protein n=1 Tax=Plenodomus tracheiphilus IPT5 TaxID=1408161 RepID=A0A6A7BP23_9PLEO|nr:hypothetical protein T440DRAFT_512651 [Plenodomus tracheiphilus IPT5]
MFSLIITLVLAAFSVQTLSSPLHPSSNTSWTPSPTCTIELLKIPSVETNCTFYETTQTATVYTDCHGCELQTMALGLGLPCRAIHTVPGTATKTLTECQLRMTAITTVTAYENYHG